ncbi:MAG TPA: hypothetical protein VL393_09270 [Candidatus Binataceae bacterium]|jgi:hypothetical protein|nr:hypothetical protein [Candidatus Binataceae bacterium]
MTSTLARNACHALVMAAVAFVAFAASATPVSATPPANFRAFGQGHEPSTTPDCSFATGNKLCPSGDSCTCTPIAGKGTCAAMGGPISYTATVATDISISAGGCAGSFGTATLVSLLNPSNQVVLNFSGTLCSTPASVTVNPANVVNAIYFIDGASSSGIFHNATGSGNVSGSRDSNIAVLGSIIGTIKLQP